MINRLQKMGVPFDDAQDIAQNIMLEIYTRYDENYIKEHKFWTLVRLRAIDYHRAMQRKQNRILYRSGESRKSAADSLLRK